MGSAAIVVGNPKPRSRTLAVAEAVMSAVATCVGEDAEALTIDLADHAQGLFDWGDEALNELTARVAQCDLIVAASPTYKASYTGLLKGFFDRYGNNGLSGVVALPVMVGAAPIHALAPELLLRPLFVELGATVPSRALYVLESQMETLDDVIAKWAGSARPLLAAALAGRTVSTGPE